MVVEHPSVVSLESEEGKGEVFAKERVETLYGRKSFRFATKRISPNIMTVII